MAGQIWSDLVKERTQGRINIKLYPGVSLVQGDALAAVVDHVPEALEPDDAPLARLVRVLAHVAAGGGLSVQ